MLQQKIPITESIHLVKHFAQSLKSGDGTIHVNKNELYEALHIGHSTAFTILSAVKVENLEILPDLKQWYEGSPNSTYDGAKLDDLAAIVKREIEKAATIKPTGAPNRKPKEVGRREKERRREPERERGDKRKGKERARSIDSNDIDDDSDDERFAIPKHKKKTRFVDSEDD